MQEKVRGSLCSKPQNHSPAVHTDFGQANLGGFLSHTTVEACVILSSWFLIAVMGIR